MTEQVDSRVEPHGRYGWRISEALGIGLVGFIVTLCFLFVVSRELTRVRFALGLTRFQISMLATAISSLATCALFAPLVVSIAKKRGFRSRWQSVESNLGKNVLYWAALGAVCGVAFEITHRLVFGINDSFHEYPVAISVGLYLISLGLVQPFIEEIYYRGLLFMALSARFGDFVSIIIVTLLFVAMHPEHRLVVLPIAVVLGITRIVTKSVASCFALHACYNLGLVTYQLLFS